MAARLARAGGRNRFGEPNFRLVWGWSRLTWIGGKWTLFDAQGNETGSRIELRREPKYFPLNRWHVERWLPPESYGSPESWRAKTTEVEDGIRYPALGPYPWRGDWEHVFTLEGPGGEFIPLMPAAIEYIVRAVLWADQWRREEKRRALFEREQRNQAARGARDDEILELAFDGVKGPSMVTVA